LADTPSYQRTLCQLGDRTYALGFLGEGLGIHIKILGNGIHASARYFYGNLGDLARLKVARLTSVTSDSLTKRNPRDKERLRDSILDPYSWGTFPSSHPHDPSMQERTLRLGLED